MTLDELLWRPAGKTWIGLREKDFFRRYEDEVSDLTDWAQSVRFCNDGSVVYHINTGYVVHEYKNKYSLYLSKPLADERDHVQAWAAFVRGAWVSRVPKEPGWYPVRDLEGRLRFRELKMVEGRLVDVSGGLVPAGKVTNWNGAWWSERVPNLPGAYT